VSRQRQKIAGGRAQGRLQSVPPALFVTVRSRWGSGPSGPKPVGSSHLRPNRPIDCAHPNSGRHFRCYERSVYCYARYFLAPDSLTHSLGPLSPKLSNTWSGRIRRCYSKIFNVSHCSVSNRCSTKRSHLSAESQSRRSLSSATYVKLPSVTSNRWSGCVE